MNINQDPTDPKMHLISVHADRAVCSCYWNKNTNTGGEAARHAHNHAQNNKPSLIRDFRTLTEEVNNDTGG